jgi:cyanophycin synthetase
LRTGFLPSQAVVIEDELEALKKAVSEAKTGDLIIVFYEKLRHLQKYLEEAGAKKQYASSGSKAAAGLI